MIATQTARYDKLETQVQAMTNISLPEVFYVAMKQLTRNRKDKVFLAAGALHRHSERFDPVASGIGCDERREARKIGSDKERLHCMLWLTEELNL